MIQSKSWNKYFYSVKSFNSSHHWSRTKKDQYQKLSCFIFQGDLTTFYLDYISLFLKHTPKQILLHCYTDVHTAKTYVLYTTLRAKLDSDFQSQQLCDKATFIYCLFLKVNLVGIQKGIHARKYRNVFFIVSVIRHKAQFMTNELYWTWPLILK